MRDTTDFIIRLINKHCSFEERNVIRKATTTVPERVVALYDAELKGTPMCCEVHAAHNIFLICKRALEKPS